MTSPTARSRGRRFSRTGTAAVALSVLAAGSMILYAQTAHAATATARVDGNVLRYEAVPGQANDVTVSVLPGGGHRSTTWCRSPPTPVAPWCQATPRT